MTVVEVRVTRDPLGRRAVLIQLEDGWVTLLPSDARRVAGWILEVADEISTSDSRSRRD